MTLSFYSLAVGPASRNGDELMQNILKRTSMAASVLALGAGIYAGASHMAAESLRARLMAATALSGAAASVDKIAVNPLTGSFRIDGMKVRQPGGATVEIGRLTHEGSSFALVTQAFAQQAHSFTVDEMKIVGKIGSLRISKIAVEGASLDQSALKSLFESGASASLIDRLKGLSFRSARAPEIAWVFQAGGDASAQTFRDVTFEGMRNGRLERASAASGTLESRSGKGPVVTGGHGLYDIRGLDTVLVARFMFDKAAPNEALATVQDSILVENFKVSADSLVEYVIGRMEVGAIRLRPLSIPLADLLLKMPSDGQPKLPPEEVKVLVPALFGLYDAFSDDGFAVSDIRINLPKMPGAGGVIARMSGSFGGGKAPAGYKIEGVAGNGPGFMFKLASMGWEGFSLKPTLNGALKAIAAGDTDLNKVDPRDLMPKLGAQYLRGLEFEFPDPKPVRGQPPGRVAGGIGAFEFSAKNEIKGIPTEMTMVYDKVALKVPMTTNDDGFKNLLALGYTAIDLSARANLKWNEARKEINLTELVLSGVNMGSARLTATVGNIGRDVFEAELPMMQVAALGATAKSVALKVENTGLAERIFEMQAKQQRRKADEIRAEMGSMAALGIPALLGPSDDAKALANALGRFLARPRNLTIEASAKNAGGIGIPDMATLSNPQQALTLVNLKASAD